MGPSSRGSSNELRLGSFEAAGGGSSRGTITSMQSSVWEGGTALEDVEVDEELEDALDLVRQVSMERVGRVKGWLVQVRVLSTYMWQHIHLMMIVN